MTQINLESAQIHMERLLSSRQHPKTICPSEVARAHSNEELTKAGVSQWRDLMPELRKRAFELRDQGQIEILQKGVVLPTNQGVQETTGPIRLRKVLKES